MNNRYKLHRVFDDLHRIVSDIRTSVHQYGSPYQITEANRFEIKVLAALKQLREVMGVPYHFDEV